MSRIFIHLRESLLSFAWDTASLADGSCRLLAAYEIYGKDDAQS
ncbi:MAG: hypothetical protein R3D71_00085 [Rickettsiales bacterium]